MAPPMTHELRIAETSDAEEIAGLVNRAYRPPAGQGGWTHESHLVAGPRTTPSQIRTLVETQPALLLLCSAAENAAESAAPQVIACVHVQVDASGCAHIGMLATLPERQGQGLGARMLRLAESHACRRLHATQAKMSVLSSRPELLAFYERRGYVPTGETYPYPVASGVGAPRISGIEVIVMARQLATPDDRPGDLALS